MKRTKQTENQGSYVVYYRVSSKQQGASGLGLDAQKSAVEAYLKAHNSEEVPPSFQEIESGKNNHRPELRKAIDRCKQTGAILLIAKLDRLSRDASFILLLKKELQAAGTDFRAVDFPDMNTMMLTVMAGMAQQEREFISARTKAGLQAARARGTILGNPQNFSQAGRHKGAQERRRAADADQHNRDMALMVRKGRQSGMNFREISAELNTNGTRTATGLPFTPEIVRYIYIRFTQTPQP